MSNLQVKVNEQRIMELRGIEEMFGLKKKSKYLIGRVRKKTQKNQRVQ